MNHFTCTQQPCDATKHEAKGMCRFHYKRTRPRTPDKPAQGACDFCGVTYTRSAYGGYKNIYGKACSEQCRYRLVYGWSTELPADHWAIMYGQTCEWTPPLPPSPPPTCSITGCDRPMHVKKLGYCATHYGRYWRTGDARAHLPLEFEDRPCEWCGASYSPDQEQARYCSHPCRRRRAKVARRALQSGAVGTHTHAQVTDLWIAQGQTCAYCYTHVDRKDVHADHVHPLSKQGSNHIDNILPVCAPCNADKRDLMLADWNTDRARRDLPPLWLGWVKDRHLTLTSNV